MTTGNFATRHAIKLIHALMEAPMSPDELHERTGAAKTTIHIWLTAFRKARPKLAYVSSWEKASNGAPIVATYAWGNKPDAKKPRKLTDAERRQRARVVKKERKFQATINIISGESHESGHIAVGGSHTGRHVLHHPARGPREEQRERVEMGQREGSPGPG